MATSVKYPSAINMPFLSEVMYRTGVGYDKLGKSYH